MNMFNSLKEILDSKISKFNGKVNKWKLLLRLKNYVKQFAMIVRIKYIGTMIYIRN